jgi:hypothetical protein
MWVGSGYGGWVVPWALWCLLQVYYSVVIVFQISSVPGYLIQPDDGLIIGQNM